MQINSNTNLYVSRVDLCLIKNDATISHFFCIEQYKNVHNANFMHEKKTCSES